MVRGVGRLFRLFQERSRELEEKRSRSDGINSAVFLFRCRLVSACVVWVADT